MSTGGPTSTQTSGLPEYLQPYVSNVLQYAQQNVNTPYTAYTGPRIAEQSPMYSYGAELLANQTASPFTDMSGIAAAQGIDTLSGLAAKGGYIDQYGRPQTQAWEGDAATTQTWDGSTFNPGAWGTYEFDNRSWTEPGIANAFMNPYITGVMDTQRREAEIAAAKQLEAYRATAASQGAFGGSRSALIEGELNKNLNTQLNDITAQGLNSAYNTGREQFNTEQGAWRDLLKTGLGQFNTDQQRALEAWKANTGQFNTEQQRGLATWLANTGQFNTDQQRALDAWRAGGSQYTNDANTAVSAGGAMQGLASVLGTAGQNDFANNRQIVQDITNLGLADEARRQRELDLDYGDFQAQRDYPVKQLQDFANLVYGTGNIRTGDTATSQAPPNWLTQMAGLGSLLWGGTK